MAAGSFSVVMDPHELVGVDADAPGKLTVRFQGGATHATVAGDLVALNEYSRRGAYAPAVQAGFTIALPTDVASGGDPDDSAVGYDLTWFNGDATVRALFVGQPDGSTVLLSDLAPAEAIPLAVSEANAAAAVAAKEAAEAAQAAAEAVGNSNDTIIASRVNDDASATRAALTRNGKKPVGRDELVLNVQDYGILPSNTASANNTAWATLTAAIADAVPGGAGSAWSRSGTITVLFPPDVTPYAFSSVLSFTSAKNVKLTSPPWGARLDWQGAGNYIIDQPSSSVGKVFDIEGLVFDGGGIRIKGPFRGFTHIHGCNFTEITAGPAVDFIDTSGGSVGVVGAVVADNNFYRCAGGVWQRSDTESLTRVERNKFNAMLDSAVLLDGFGISILDNDFQSVISTAATTANYINLLGTDHSTGSANIERNRFGSEEFTDGADSFHPPAYYIATSRGTEAVAMRGNRFRSPGTPTSSMADAAIKLGRQPFGWTVRDNLFEGFNSNIVLETWVATWPSNVTGNPNVWSGNTVTVTHTKPVFSNGGVLWQQDNLGNGSAVAGASLLPSVDLSGGSWTRVNTTVSRNATGPDGSSTSAFTLTRTSSSANSSVRATVSGTGGLVSFTVWLKAGTLSKVRWALTRTSDSRQFINNSLIHQLTDEWRPYTFTTYAEAGSSNFQLWLYVGESSTASTGTVLVWAPKLEASALPRPAMPAMEMVSPDGTRYKVTVANGGTLTVAAL